MRGSPVESVIIRIFYSLDRGRTGKIQLRQFRESNFMATLKAVDGTNDINLVRHTRPCTIPKKVFVGR